MLRSEGDRTMQVPLGVIQKYSIATHNYSSDEQEIMKILGIDSLIDMRFWESAALAKNRDPLMPMITAVRFAMSELPKIVDLFKQDWVEHFSEIATDGNGESVAGERSILQIIVVEESDRYSSPERISRALESIASLYNVHAELEKESNSDLVVLACDSGSDKSFDFLGLAKLMEQVKETILAIWDRRLYSRHQQMSASLNLISESLPVIERIEKLSVDGALSPEQAELLKRKAISGATAFLESGVTIPEIDSVSSIEPKKLLKPETRLLAAPFDSPVSNEEDETEFDVVDENDLDASQERKLLAKLLAREAKRTSGSDEDVPEDGSSENT